MLIILGEYFKSLHESLNTYNIKIRPGRLGALRDGFLRIFTVAFDSLF